jgi:16S rRNA (adenine1518-N6/adenine1519-N6)-dimethyltransferase
LSHCLGHAHGVWVEGRCAVSILSQQDYYSISSVAKGRPRKSLGQHYLVDGAVLGQIIAAAELAPDDAVVEVGPGKGSLTRRLVQHAGQVIALEVDHGLASTLSHRLGEPANLTIVEADARTVEISDLTSGLASYKLVANLPYYAANPIIRRFLEAEDKPSLMVVMVQREVAQSMLAKPGNMGILSVAAQYYAVPRLVCHVPARAFRPQPKVTSSVVRLEVRQRPAVEVRETETFFETLRAGFSAPRKQLHNSLSQGLKAPGDVIGPLLASLNIDGRRRAETLTLKEWAQIHHAWEEMTSVAGPGLRQD